MRENVKIQEIEDFISEVHGMMALIKEFWFSCFAWLFSFVIEIPVAL